MPQNNYINSGSLFWLLILSIQNSFFLYLEKNKRDPFILILVANTILFYMIRVFSLIYYYPDIRLLIDNVSYNSPYYLSLNYTLIYIFSCNGAIVAGLRAVRSNITYKCYRVPKNNSTNSNIVLIILLIQLISGFLNRFSLDSTMDRVLSFIVPLLNNSILVLFTLIYLLENKYMSNLQKRIFYILFLSIPVVMTLNGSRAGILTISVYLIIGLFSKFNEIKVGIRNMIIFAVFLIIGLGLFTLANEVRTDSAIKNQGVISDEQIQLGSNINSFGLNLGVKELMYPIFTRLGYIDYSVELINRSEFYRQIINLEYYFKSIVDNGLTPGFDIFNTATISTSLKYINYGNMGSVVGKSQARKLEYHSDALTIYGESYVFAFGYLALPLVFLISYGFKKAYSSINNKDLFSFILIRSLILLVFFNGLNSYGADWTLNSIISITITYFLFARLFRSKGPFYYNVPLNSNRVKR